MNQFARMRMMVLTPGAAAEQFTLNTTLVGTVTFSWTFSSGGGPMTVDWGDGVTTSHSATLSHTFTASGTKKMTFTCPDWSKVTYFTALSQTLTGALPSFARLINATNITLVASGFSGAIPDFSLCTKMAILDAHYNSLTGTLLPPVAPTTMTKIDVSDNQLSGSLPSFAGYTALVTATLGGNRFTGALPAFTGCTGLKYLNVAVMTGAKFTGSIPDFSTCTELLTVALGYNNFSGTLPDFSACTKITSFTAQNNLLTGYTAGSFATQKNLATVNLSNNYLTQAAIESMLDDLVTSLGISGRVTCTVTLNGANMATLSADGIADVVTLRAAGWSITYQYEHPYEVLIGDSITVQWGQTFQAAYASGHNSVFNYAVSGAQVIGTVIQNSIAAQAAAYASHFAGDDYLIVAMGTNDGETGDAFRVAYEAAVNTIIAKNTFTTIFCLAILPRTDMTGVVAKNALISTAATNLGATYVDTSAWIDAGDLSDGVHLNSGGIAKVQAQVIALLPA